MILLRINVSYLIFHILTIYINELKINYIFLYLYTLFTKIGLTIPKD
jgi:hypothetical protein